MDGMAWDDSGLSPDAAGMAFAGDEAASETTAQGLVRCAITPRGGDDRVNERSTEVFDCVFTDEAGAAVTPGSFFWTLLDNKGAVINQRERQQIMPAGGTVPVLLSGPDLQLQTAEAGYAQVTRRLLIEATFSSDLGQNLPLNVTKEFTLINLPRIG